MPPLPPYDQAFLRRQAALTRQILQHYEDGISFLIPTLNAVRWNGRLFKLSEYPLLKKRIDAMAAKLQNQIYTTTVNGIKDSWDFSNKKNDVLVDKRLSGSRLKKKAHQALYDPNDAALKRFIERNEKGLNLSQRVWNAVDPFKKELEQSLGISIGKGEPAVDMAKEIKRNLREPDRLFRRVRGEDGKLYLSAAARMYNPGQGVYRSSFKNALRLARTENNMSYRTADHERWKSLPFITGIQVRLSSAHPKIDICDHLAGKYPKDFKFVGWHPQCLCFAVPEEMSDEEYSKLEDQILAGEPITVAPGKLIQSPPPGFTKYLADKKDMLAALKSEPYWMRDNKQYLGRQIIMPAKTPVVEKLKAFSPAKSIKEAEAWAYDNLGVKYVSFKNIDLDIANDINKSVYNIKQVMPEIRTMGIGSAQQANRAMREKIIAGYKDSDWYKNNVTTYGKNLADKAAVSFANRHVEKVRSGVIAWSSNKETVGIVGGGKIDVSEFAGVFVNEKEAKSKALMDAMIKRNRDAKWFTESANDFGYIMSHEIGHEIDKTIGFRQTSAFQEIFKRETALGAQSVTDKLSKYAATAGGRRNHLEHEMIAESWAEFMTSKSPRPLAKEIGELMLKTYYEKNKTTISTTFTEWYAEIVKIVRDVN